MHNIRQLIFASGNERSRFISVLGSNCQQKRLRHHFETIVNMVCYFMVLINCNMCPSKSKLAYFFVCFPFWSKLSFRHLAICIYLLQDIDTYKNSAKDEIMDWMNTLKKCGTAHDWMVVLVETPESRKGANKLLPRTSVVDRLRTDVGTKFSDRCLTLTGENYIPGP